MLGCAYEGVSRDSVGVNDPKDGLEDSPLRIATSFRHRVPSCLDLP